MATFTNHARTRIRQRGLRHADVEFVLQFGTETADGVILSNQDADCLVADAKRTIAMAERLRGQRIVADGDTIITVFRADRRQQHALLHA